MAVAEGNAQSKVCTSCGEDVPLSGYGRQASCRDGLRPSCRRCYTAYMADWRARNRQRMRDHQKAYNARRTPEQVEAKRQQDLAYYYADPAAARERILLRHYRITQARYDEMLAAQNGGCGICGGDNGAKVLAVDHNHACCPGIKSCGKCVRGLLCGKCNNGLGQFKDNVALLSKAVSYLTSY